MDNRKKLREKLKQKRENRSVNAPTPDIPFLNGETDFVKMMDQVNKILKTNPEMVRQVSKCVSNVMGNPELMKSLVGQVQDCQDVQEDQIFDKSELTGDLAASTKDSKQ